MKFTSDPNKQITIMAQSAMRLATDLVIADKVKIDNNIDNLQHIAAKIMRMELELVTTFLDSYKEIATESRTKDIKKAFAAIKTADDLIKLWSSLSEDEQVEYQSMYDKVLKKIK